MNKSDLVNEVSKRTDVPVANVTKVVNAFLDVIGDELKEGNKVTLVNFGSFEAKEYAETKGRNPRNPEEEITVPSQTRPKFKASKKLKEKINEK